MCTPAAATVPFLSAMGFGASGPVAGKSPRTSRMHTSIDQAPGSAATGIMSYFATVPAGGIVATMQSAAMGGYGASAAAGAAQAGAVLSSFGAWVLGRNVTGK
jgi:hypothetical protein